MKALCTCSLNKNNKNMQFKGEELSILIFLEQFDRVGGGEGDQDQSDAEEFYSMFDNSKNNK